MNQEIKLKTIVVDDEPLAAMLIEGYVDKTPFLEKVGVFSTAIEAMNSVELATADLIFLDIQMPMLTGLEFSRMISPETRIIFTTAFNEYALDGYRVSALDYLLKPISYVDFLVAARKAYDWFELKIKAESSSLHSIEKDEKETLGVASKEAQEGEVVDSIYVKSEYKLLRIELDKLLYVEGLKDYVKFCIEGEKKAILSLMNMKRAEEILPSNQFIRVHRSFIVRKDKIRVVERSRIIFGEERIPVGDSYKDALQDYLRVLSV